MNTSTKLLGQLESIIGPVLNEKCGKKMNRDAGKVMNQSFSGQGSVAPSPKNANRISEEYMIKEIGSLVRKLQKYQ